MGATLSGEHTISGAGIVETLSGDVYLVFRSDWVFDVSAEIKELLLLSEGWDGGVAMPISVGAVSNAKRLAEQAAEVIPHLRRPAVTPTVDGRVVLTWHGTDAHIEITSSEAALDVFYELEAPSEDWEGPLAESPRNPADLLSKYFR